MEIKSLQKPDDQSGKEDDRKGALDEVFGLVPQQVGNVFGTWHAVVGQLHDERRDCAFFAYPFGD